MNSKERVLAAMRRVRPDRPATIFSGDTPPENIVALFDAFMIIAGERIAESFTEADIGWPAGMRRVA